VRFVGPPGLQVTFFQGMTPARAYPAPVVVGLRPGYPYRVRIAGWPQSPGLVLYPTLEVRGVLHLPPKLSAASYPVPVVVTESDLERVAAGSLVTKVIYLECPDLAQPAASRSDDLLELTLPVGQDPVAEARERGRVMLIVRFGQREVSPQELVQQTVAGTILLPGDRALPQPQKPPFIPWAGWQVFDPFLGPRLATEECLHDGGDIGPRAGIGPDGRLAGVDPSDSVAEYADSKGRRQVTVSNRICLCVPRFAVVRAECPISRYDSAVALGGAYAVLNQNQLEMRVPSREAEQIKPVLAMTGRKRPTEALARQGVGVLARVEVLQPIEIEIGPVALVGTNAARTLTEQQRARLARQVELARALSRSERTQEVGQTVGTAVLGKVAGLDTISASVETRDLTVCCNEPPRLPDRPLYLFKWADARAAQVGEVVTFYLKYSNHGGQPITDIAVVDSLTGRLEYVAGSAKSNRAAVFTTQENEAGSVILRWEVSGRLLPGESGVVRFQARIR
jgi:uncharacterized repeat protein (TIGR01451 family)